MTSKTRKQVLAMNAESILCAAANRCKTWIAAAARIPELPSGIIHEIYFVASRAREGAFWRKIDQTMKLEAVCHLVHQEPRS